MVTIESILKGAITFVAGGLLFLSACDNPVAPPKPVPEPPKPSIYQTAEIENLVDIKYNAILKNLKEPKLNVSKNGSPLLSRAIQDSAYSETFSYLTNREITKGDYTFILNGKTLSGKDTSITASVVVPTYSFTASLSNLNFDEDADTTVTLPSPIFKNPEDNPAVWTDVTSLDGKTSPQLNGSELTIKGNANQIGDYNLRLGVRSNTGRNEATTKCGSIENLLDVEGVLEDNEQHLRQLGVVRVYDENNARLGEIEVSASGQFNKRLNYRISNLTNHILVQGKKVENGEQKSYVRTTKLPRGDVRGVELRVVPYDGLAENGITPDDFSRHFREVSTPDNTNGKGSVDALTLNPVIYKWEEIPEFIISRVPNDSTIQAFFGNQTREQIKVRILDLSDIGSWYGGIIISPEKIKFVESYDISQPGNEGKVAISPSNVNRGGSFDITGDGYLDVGSIEIFGDSNGILSDIVRQAARAHEFGHASGQNGHAITLPQEKTIMVPGFNQITLNYFSPRFADKKIAKAIYEDTYKHGQGRDLDGLLRVYDILGRRFLDE